MEGKLIIYLIIGVVYFLYSIGKKVEANKKSATSTPDETKPVSPPVANPLEEIMREIKRKQTEADAKKKASMPSPKPLTSSIPKKELLIHEKQKGVFAEGNYERFLTDEEKVERGKLQIENEGIYKIKPIGEEEEEQTGFELDARNAIIGSIIFERKF
ncbi:MAG: hypothetical protein NTY88_12270 [Bacteroidetes bacterium]|nr:hypothetical protein [Bacteroidota bacterium]